MIKTMEKSERDTILRVADNMVTAAITAPKASGKDKVIAMVLTDSDKDRLTEVMRNEYKETGLDFINRDANNIDQSECIVIIGVRTEPFAMSPCGMCGFKNCGEMMKAGANCAFNVTDLGVAVGSAVSVAADHRIDNRVMYSAGRGAIKMGLFDEEIKVCYGIPLYAGSKSIYFDRAPGAVLL